MEGVLAVLLPVFIVAIVSHYRFKTKQLEAHKTRARELLPEIPQGIEAAVMRSLAKDPLARFADAADLGQALRI